MATTTAIHFDESGFTGTHLLDPDQTFFTVASSIVPDAEAADLLRSSFPRYKAREFKFVNIWRRSANREGLLTFAGELKRIQDNLFIWVVDKRFCTLTKLVDFLIEPVISAAGYNFYSKGFPPRYCNWVHFGLTTFAPPGLYQATLEAYHEVARFPSDESLDVMTALYRQQARRGPKELREFFNLAYEGAARFKHFHDLGSFDDSNEIQLTSVLTSVSRWRQRRAENFEVLHDQSNNFFNQEWLWAAITRDDVPLQQHPMADGTFAEFPLRVTRTIACVSEDHPAIQLCDVIAGLFSKTMKLHRSNENSDFLTRLLSAGLGDVTYGGINPQPEFPNGPPALATGPDVVDRMAAILFHHGSDDKTVR